MRTYRLSAILLALSLAACATPPGPHADPNESTFPPVEYARASAPSSSGASTLSAATADQDCADKFIGQRQPVLMRYPPSAEASPICFRRFAVLYSTSRRGPMWSAYRLTKKMSEDGDTFTGARPSYHSEAKLPAGDQARPTDFAANVYDVGHMTPNNDMPDEPSQFDSFSMANMSPQYETLNRVAWRAVEKTVHDLAQSSGEIYIVTGPIYSDRPKLMSGRVAIPAAFFKAVYDAASGKAIAFVFANVEASKCELLNISDLQDRAGIRPFPSLPKSVLDESGEWTVPKACT